MIKVEGVDKLMKKLQKFGAEAETRVSAVVMSSANEIASKATQKLSSYTDVDGDGKIAQSINVFPLSPGAMNYTIGVNQLPMGAYVEFGTGIFVEVAEEWKDTAWAFYVNGKGWMHPRPYLYPAFTEGVRQYKADLQDLLEHLTNRYSS